MSFAALPTPDDHAQGHADARVILVQYGDFECPFSGAAYDAIQAVQGQLGEDLGYVFRSFPLPDVHPHALHAAEAAEAAGAQGQFWPMYDLLFSNQDALEDQDLVGYAGALDLDLDRFVHELRSHTYRSRLRKVVEDAQRHGVHGTPTFLINGEFHDNDEGLWSADALLAAVKRAASR